MSRHQLFLILFLSLLLLSEIVGNWSFLVKPAYAADTIAARNTPPSFTFQQYLKQGPQHAPVRRGAPSPYPQPPKRTTTTGTKPITPPPSAEPATMKPVTQSLTSAFLAGGTGASALDLKGSDGRLEVQLHAGSLELAQATVTGGKAPSGGLTLQVTQLHGHYEAMLNQLGEYQLQVIDSQGHVVSGIKLRTPVTIIYHYQPSEMLSLNLDPAHMLLSWPTLLFAARQAKQPTTNLAITMHDDPTTHTLTAQSLVLGPGPLTMTNDGQNQMAPVPHLAEVQGNNGQLSYSYPLQVVPGSGGFTPQLTLAYSSMGPNDRHSKTSSASDEGDGWSLSLGSITANYYSTSGATWYFINGIGNVSDRLIEYDTTNKLFYTEHLSYLLIQQVTSSTGQPCFDVWDKSGTFYEVGCTKDSLEYSMVGTTRSNYQWNVDRIIAPNEGPKGTTSTAWKIILISYLQDCDTASTMQPCPDGNTIRDAVIKQITYGYNTTGGSLTTLDATAGTIDFTYLAPFSYAFGGVNWATAYTYDTGGNDPCTSPPTPPTLRCDDPIQEQGSGSYFTAPDVLGTFSLANITSYLNTDSLPSNATYGYNFTYSDSPFQNCTDPISGLSGYCAGEHLLTKITPSVYQGGTAHTLRATTFSYSPLAGSQALTDTYYDSLNGFTTTTTWQYLTDYQDLDTGIGGHITYALAHNNSDGTPTIKNGSNIVTDDRYDALYCTTNANNSDLSLRCTGIYGYPDDRAWSVQVVTSITSSGKDNSALNPATTTYNYYRLANTYPYTHQSGYPWCQPDQYPGGEQDCVGDNWFASGDSDWGDYYHAEFRGFNQVWHLSPAGDLTIDYSFSTEGWNRPATDPADYLGGQLQQEEIYQGGSYDTAHILRRTVDTYPTLSNPTDPTTCYTPTGSSPYAACDTVLLSSKTTEYDGTGGGNANAPWVEHDYTYDDYDTAPHGLKGGYHNLIQEVISGSNLPNAAPNLVYPLTRKWSYATNNAPGSWTYYTVDTVSHSEIDDANGHVWQCQYTSYDEGNTNPTPSAGWPTTVQTFSSDNCAMKTNPPLTTTYTDYDAYGNVVATVDGVGAATAPLYTSTGCIPTSSIEIANSAWTQGRYTTCANYDTGHYEALSTDTANAFSQATGYTYDVNQGNALTKSTDPNSQVTNYSYSYDGSGNRTVQATLPPDSTHYTTQANSYSTCTGSSTLPCYEVDKLSYQYNTVLSSTFYDSQGRAVETSTPGPAPTNPQAGKAYYTIVFTYYNDANHSTYQSLPFVVAVPNTQHGSGYIDPTGVTDYLGNTPGGTATYYDALGRALAMRDPTFGSAQEPGLACSVPLSGNFTACTNYGLGTVSGDTNTYAKASSIDPNNHVTVSSLDVLGRTVYVSYKSGKNSGTLTTNELKAIQYNALDQPISVVVTDKVPQSGQSTSSITTTAQYDDLGRLTQVSDPDRGTHSYTYDADGRVLTDVSGTTRTIGNNYDLLGRLGCVQDAIPITNATGACSAGHPYVQNTYDTTELGTQGSTDFPVGHLTQSVATTYFLAEGTSATATQQMQHDQRGRVVTETLSLGLPSSWNVTTALPTYQRAVSYNDADQVRTTTTTTNPVGQGYTTTVAYDSITGVETGLSNNTGDTPDLATLVYNASARLDTINFQTNSGSAPALAGEQFSYDANLRPTTTNATWLGNSGNTGTILSQSRSYDNAGNVISLTTTQAAVPNQAGSGGSETQNFCYDEQNRLVWAGNSGTQPAAGNGTCGTATLSNTLSGASYTSSYVYTHLGQLWQGSLSGGSTQYQYLYCGSNNHLLTGLYPLGTTCANLTGAVYTSSYDAFGNVTSRSYSGTTATLSYDNLDHFTEWNAGSANREWYVYDAAGNRVLRRTINSTSTTMRVYAFGLEEHKYGSAGANLSNTYYYSLGGRLLGALDSNGTTFYLTDALGSVLASFNNPAGSAVVKGNQVFGPYGNARDVQGTINTAKGFTGQYNDSLTGLDYYNARYYDPVVGVFLSADSKQGNLQGMNPYAYVNGNPETYNDPTGQYIPGPGGERCYLGSGGPTCVGGVGTIVGGGGTTQPSTGGTPSVGQGPSAARPRPPIPHAGNGEANNQEDGACPSDTECWSQAVKVKVGQENSAHHVAETARDHFNEIADGLKNLLNNEWFNFFIGVIAGQNKYAAAMIVGFILALHLVEGMAKDLANGFAYEVSQDLSWFTVDNITNKGDDILKNTVITGGTDIGISLALAGVGALIAEIPGAEGLGVAIAAGSLTVAGVVDVAGAILYQQADDYVSQQVTDIESSN